MNVFKETRKSIRAVLKKRKIRVRELMLVERAMALEQASSHALRAAEVALDNGDFEVANELLDDETKLSFEAGELRLQASNLRGAL